MTYHADALANLRTRITRIVRETTGMHEKLVMPITEEIIKGLQSEFGGDYLYVPVPSKKDRDRLIIDSWRCGMTPQQMSESFDIHIATVYRVISDRKKKLASHS